MEPKLGIESSPVQDGSYTCKCPNCGQDIKLSKAEPKMPMKSPGESSLGEPASETPDMASMIDSAASDKY